MPMGFVGACALLITPLPFQDRLARVHRSFARVGTSVGKQRTPPWEDLAHFIQRFPRRELPSPGIDVTK